MRQPANTSVLVAAGGEAGSGPIRVESIGDRDRWNRLVTALPSGELEQGWEWAEVLRGSGARCSRYAILGSDGEGLAAVSVLAWPLRPFPLTVLDVSRGPSIRTESPAAWAGVVATVREVAAATNAVFARLSPPVPEGQGDVHRALLRHGFAALPDSWTLWNAPKVVMTLALDGTEDAVWRRISNRRRREIRLAREAGVEIDDGRRVDLDEFYQLLLDMGRVKRYPVRRLAHFEALHRAYVGDDHGVFRVARWKERVVGGLIGGRLAGRAYLLYAAADRGPAPRDGGVRAGPLLYWDFIQWATSAGCRTIHWGGSGTHLPPRSDDPGYGVFQFKRSFGSSCWAYLGYYDLVFRPRLYPLLRAAERRLGPLLWRLRARLNR